MQREDLTTARRLLEEALVRNREMDDRWGAASPLGTLAMVAQAEGDFPAASRLLREALLTCREVGDLNETRRLLTQLGFLSLACGRPEEAARRREGRRLGIEEALAEVLDEKT
jgi:hypothetical protein